MTYTNDANIPLSMAIFLATDHYDYVPGTISATKLLKPTRQLIMAERVPVEMQVTDIADLIAARTGTAIHTGIEDAWQNHHVRAMQKLGYKQEMIDKIRINPKPGTLKAGEVPVYMEIRSEKTIAGKRVVGKFDFVGNGALEDFKTTSAYSYMSGSKDFDYAMQGSIYRWLNPDIITKDVMSIQFIFTDWQRAQAKQNPNYPQKKTETKRYKLIPVTEVEAFVTKKITDYDKYRELPDEQIPYCTDEELWRDAPVWKYYKDPSKMARSTKNFDNEADAYERCKADGNVGMVVHNPGQAKACLYCPGFAACKQKDELIRDGHLEI